jgi:hypothetical protein
MYPINSVYCILVDNYDRILHFSNNFIKHFDIPTSILNNDILLY